ncbi:Protein CBG20010 [Caenorhabditis briggsae]|uniref:Protein CBG20010 n=1 Tax=Caenorhabditis briggsae TaxID=6238 RepID=A8XWX4_CAEBR|nr:Protein CBG20010 [Caenorhabditis briggsae]CAP37143.1 Protein CBG20010 [Caenorhabditis briggsae]
MSTESSGKKTTEKEEGRKTGTFANRDSTASSPPPLGPSSKKTKADRSRSFDAVPANTMTAEENNIYFN